MMTKEPGLGRGPLAREIQRRIAPVPLDPAMKGLPTAPPGSTVGDIGEFGWSVINGDLPTPFAAVSPSALEHNARLMAEYCARRGVSLAPHAKTTMAPQLIDLQLATERGPSQRRQSSRLGSSSISASTVCCSPTR